MPAKCSGGGSSGHAFAIKVVFSRIHAFTRWLCCNRRKHSGILRWLICICSPLSLLVYHHYSAQAIDELPPSWADLTVVETGEVFPTDKVNVGDALLGHIAEGHKYENEMKKHAKKQEKLNKSSSKCKRGPAVTPLDFGARGDGVADDTEPVKKAFQYCTHCSGASIIIGPNTSKFLVYPGKIKVELNNVVVRFEGEMLGPSLNQWNPTHMTWPKGSCAYGQTDCGKHNGPNPEYARSKWTMLHIVNSTNVSILGPGGMRAPGITFWLLRYKRPEVRGYCMLKIDHSHHVRLSGFALMDSPMYHMIIMHSRDVDVSWMRVQITTANFTFNKNVGKWGPENTDGVNILASEDVRITDSEISCGDDNVVIKEASRGIVAERLHLKWGKGINVGSLGEGGSKSQTVADLAFRDIRVDRCRHGVRIKTWKGGHGIFRNASFYNISLNRVKIGIFIDQTYCPAAQRPEGCSGSNDSVSIEHLTFDRFIGTFNRQAGAGPYDIRCVRCTGIVYDKVEMVKSDKWVVP